MANRFEKIESQQTSAGYGDTGAPPEFINGIPPALGAPLKMNRFEQIESPAEPSPEQQPTLSWPEAIRSGITKYPAGVMKLFGDVAHAFTNPQESIPALWSLVQAAAAVNPGNIAGIPGRPGVSREGMGNFNAVAEDYKQHYGTEDALKNTVANEPVRLTTDLATLVAPFAGPAEGTLAAIRAASPVAGKALTAADALVNPLVLAEPIARGAGHVVRAGVNALDPEARLMMKATEGREVPTLNALNNAQEIVPGSKPTGAQAIAAMENPPTKIIALGEKGVKDRLPTEFGEKVDEQNAARLEHSRQVARSPEELQAAIDVRNTDAARNYAAAGVPSNDPALRQAFPAADVPIPVDQELLDMISLPSIRDAIPRVARMAAEEGRPLHIGAGGTTSAADLHVMKMALDDMISNPEQFGIGASEVSKIRNTRNNLVDWLEYHNPAYRTARQEYADASQGIDQMKIGQYLENQLKNPTLGDETPSLRADSFSRAIQDAITQNTSIRKATGQQRYRNLGDIFTPEQMDILNSIQADMARAKKSEGKGKLAGKFASELDNTTPALQSPNFLSAPMTVFNALSRTLSGHVSGKVADTVANALLTPEATAEMLQRAIDVYKHNDRLSVPSHIVGRLIGDVNRLPAGYNALRVVEDDQKKKKKKRNALAP